MPKKEESSESDPGSASEDSEDSESDDAAGVSAADVGIDSQFVSTLFTQFGPSDFTDCGIVSPFRRPQQSLPQKPTPPLPLTVWMEMILILGLPSLWKT